MKLIECIKRIGFVCWVVFWVAVLAFVVLGPFFLVVIGGACLLGPNVGMGEVLACVLAGYGASFGMMKLIEYVMDRYVDRKAGAP